MVCSIFIYDRDEGGGDGGGVVPSRDRQESTWHANCARYLEKIYDDITNCDVLMFSRNAVCSTLGLTTSV